MKQGTVNQVDASKELGQNKYGNPLQRGQVSAGCLVKLIPILGSLQTKGNPGLSEQEQEDLFQNQHRTSLNSKTNTASTNFNKHRFYHT